eukprot:gene1455-15879_t
MATALTLIASFLALYLAQGAEASCVSDNHVNGCSIPLSVPFPYKAAFNPACYRHDVCYFCGQKYGWSRADCDRAFKRDMEAICVATFNRKRFFIWEKTKNLLHLSSEIAKWPMIIGDLPNCKHGAYIYYLAVSYFAQDNYERTSPVWCLDPCAKSKGNPNLSNNK